jgi:hypothetical protein
MSKPIRKAKIGKPRPDFPLFPHATGRWAKKVRSKFHYFGKLADDPDGQVALNVWLDQKDALLAGRTPGTKVQGLTTYELVNRFLEAKSETIEAGKNECAMSLKVDKEAYPGRLQSVVFSGTMDTGRQKLVRYAPAVPIKVAAPGTRPRLARTPRIPPFGAVLR